ncbi:MAG: hydroxylamine reductase [Phycisphaerae bacterium]
MFCYQCEQTAKGTGCTSYGVCGKGPETANVQDSLVHITKGVAQYGHRARQLGVSDDLTNHFVLEALFTTVTNVNFDEHRIADVVRKGAEVRDHAKKVYHQACEDMGKTPEEPTGPAEFQPSDDDDELFRMSEQFSIEMRQQELGETIAGLQELLMYGLKGMAAYADHAQIIGKEEDGVYGFFLEALDFLADNPTDIDALLGMILRCGEVNLKVMGLLDAGHCEHFGSPEPTQVRVTPVKGKAIVVTGHDLADLEELLKQTEGKGINVYTHSEMLPAHGYPELKKYKHLVGNYGGAWQDQRVQFDEFPGAILFTTNCLQKPKESYKDRVFTTGVVGWDDVTHIPGAKAGEKDFSPLIEAAQKAEGFTEDGPEKYITVGFAHDAVMGVADKVVGAVKSGDIRHFFLIGGCDGAKTGRNYYTEFAQSVPDDCVILTLACGKYRFNKFDFGDIGGIPRLLDVGQCNDAYSAIQIALALSEAFDCGVNDLPLSFILSWYEQKAVVILLTLLYLGIQDMRLGPTLPAFVTQDVLNVLVEKFNIKPIGEVQEDLDACLSAN